MQMKGRSIPRMPIKRRREIYEMIMLLFLCLSMDVPSRQCIGAVLKIQKNFSFLSVLGFVTLRIL